MPSARPSASRTGSSGRHRPLPVTQSAARHRARRGRGTHARPSSRGPQHLRPGLVLGATAAAATLGVLLAGAGGEPVPAAPAAGAGEVAASAARAGEVLVPVAGAGSSGAAAAADQPSRPAEPTSDPDAQISRATPTPEPCLPGAGGGTDELVRHTPLLGAAALGASGIGCVGEVWAALPPTELERTDREMLLALVTRERAVEPVDYAPEDLVLVEDGPFRLRAEAAEQLAALVAAAEDAGHPHLTVSSGYRAHDVQAGTYEDWVNRLGEDQAELVSARPGHSEHQLGLAVDVGGECGLYQCFGEAEDGRWVAENAHRWGFIVRYPEGGQEVTGYAWEPWHLRYVGPQAAWQMRLSGEVYWERAQPEILGATTP